MTSTILPGTLLGNRYRLEDLLDDVEDARFFRATDVTLGRNVSAFVMPEEDDRVLPLLEAARTSAAVGDPHVLRVLDADVRSGYAWVVNEWGSGQSLDVMVSREPLPAERAAWLVREVASAISVAHAKGLAHGRLAPENVMVTESGTVRLIGFAVDATIQTARLRSGNYPDCTPEEADLLDLGGLLYTGLVGRWPGASGSHVRPAPRDARGPLSPRQVRAGVPRPLDAICARVLAHKRPNRTAAQLAAVLTEYLGETEGADLPRELPPADPELESTEVESTEVDEAEVPADDEQKPEEPSPRAVPTPYVDPEPLTADELWPTPATEAATEPTAAIDVARLVAEQPGAPGWWPEPEAGVDAGPEAAPELDDTSAAPFDPDATAVSEVVFEEPLTAADQARLDPGWRRPAPAAPPPPEPDPVPERPLFAPEGTRRPRADVPASSTSQWGSEVAARAARQNPGTALDDSGESFALWQAEGPLATSSAAPTWPLGADPEDVQPDDWEERTSRHWLRLPLLFLLLAVVAVLVAVFLTFGGKPNITLPGGNGDKSSASPTVAGGAIQVAAITDLDPYATPPTENADEARLAIDGKARTAWTTSTYRGSADLGGLKPGVGLLLDLGSVQSVGSVELRLVGQPTNVALYTAPSDTKARPTGIEGLDEVATQDGAGPRLTMRPAAATSTRYVVVWLTSLPAVDGGFRGGVAEITVHG